MAKKRPGITEGGLQNQSDAGGPLLPGHAGAVQILLDRLRTGKVVLCTGAALGAAAGRPTWREIVERLLDRLESSTDVIEARAMLDTRPLTTSGYVKRSLGAAFQQALSETLPKNGVMPEMVEHLTRLPFRAILTTAYDDLLERAFQSGGHAMPVYTAYNVEDIRREGRGRYILHVLGSPKQGTDVVFGSGDLQRVLAEEPFRHLLRDMYYKRSLLFLGFDANDPDFEILIDRLMAGVGGPGAGVGVTSGAGPAGEPRHFAVLPGLPRVARDELEAAFGIHVLHDADALTLVRQLRDLVGEHAGEILPDDDDMEGWLRILQQEPGRADAAARLDALAHRLHDAGDADKLIELWVGRVEVEVEPARRATCLRRVAELLENDKGQMAEAFASMLEAYKEDPQPDVLDELERLAGTTGQWVDLLSALREIVPQLPAGQRADAWVRIARLYGDKLNHLDYALGSLLEAQKLDIADEATRRQMRELRVELNRRAERWKDLADALGQLAAHSTDRERKIDLYLEQGEIYETRLSDGVSATQAFRRALEANPESRDALSALEHLLRRMKNWAELVPLLDRKAALLDTARDSAGSQQARREAAALASEHLDAREGIARWEAVRRDYPRDPEALRALEKFYAKEGSYSDHYLGVLNDLADVVSSDKERVALYRRLAAEYEELPGHLAQAAACLEKILDLDPSAEDAYRGLERLYRQDRKWILLVDTYRRHAQQLPAAAARTELHAAVAKVYETDLPAGDARQALLAAPQAIEAWNEVLDIQPEHAAALEALGRLYQQTEAYTEAIRVLDKRANLADDRNEKVALRYLAGRLTVDHLRDYRQAEERFVRALEVDPQHVPTMSALVELYRGQGEYLRAAKLLIEAEQHTQNRLDKTRYLVEAAELFGTVDDQQRAAELYLQALKVDPEHVEAGARVQEILWQQKRYPELVPVLEMLTRREGSREEQVRRLGRLGQAALAVGDPQKALRAFGRAAEIDPADLAAQRGRARLHFDAGQYQEAADALSAVLMHHRDDLSAGEMVEVFYTLGECERRLDRLPQAKNFFHKALEIDPEHRPTLQAELLLADLVPAQKVELKRSLLPTAQPEEKAQLLTEIGDLLAPEDKDAALESYKDALMLRPESHLLLHKCLEIYSEQKRWAEAADVLDLLIAHEQNQKRRARYRQTAALLARDELHDYPRAMTLFNAALDDDPTLERSAADLERLALEQQDAKELSRIYRRKIKQLGPDTEASTREQRAERLRLWTALGQLCAEKLGDIETALAAFEVAAALDRGNLDRHRQLAALYIQAGPDKADKAILEHQAILRMNKGELGSYRALKKLYQHVKQREKAAAVAYALHILRKGEPEDEKLVAELKARPLAPAKRPLKAELWRTLAHPEEDLQMGALFQTVLPHVQLAYARPFKDAGLNRKERIEPAAPQLYAKVLRYTVEVFDSMAPEAYAQPEQKERPYAIVHCADKGQAPVLCVQLGALLLNPKRPEKEITYEIGRLAALLQPKRALRTLLSTPAQLGMIVDAAMALGAGPQGGPWAQKVTETAQNLKRSLAPAVAEQVAAYGRALRDAGTRGEAAAQAWLGWSDMTAVRAGLVLAGDLETVALLLATDPPGNSPLSPKQRLLELLHFSVTEEYFTIRQYLGLMG